MSRFRRAATVLVATAAVAGGGVAFATDALAVAKAPGYWGCDIHHYLGGPPEIYDSYYSECTTMPAGHKQALLVTCKLGPGEYQNVQGPWVYNNGDRSGVNCNAIGGYYYGAYEILGS